MPLAVRGGAAPGPQEEDRTIGAQPSMALSEIRCHEWECRGIRTL